MRKRNIFYIILCMFVIILVGCTSESNNVDVTSVSPIFNVNEYSRISSSELIEKMGEPASIEDWTNKTPTGEYALTTYIYDVDGIHYEFVIAEDAVVRVTLYSNQYWNNEGDLFTYNNDDKSDLRYLFEITDLRDSAKISDNNVNFEISPVSDTVANFRVMEVDSENKTFGFARITYNVNYF
jgi:hypothetical protein